MEYHDDYDGDVEHVTYACNLTCDETSKRCVETCAEGKIVEDYYTHYLEGVDIVDKGVVTYDSVRDLVKYAKDKMTPYTIDLRAGRLYVDDGMVGAIAKESGLCRDLLRRAGLDDDVVDYHTRDGTTICTVKSKLDEFRENIKEYSRKGFSIITDIYRHPMLRLALAKRFPYVNVKEPEYISDRYAGYKGLFDHLEFAVGINPVWIDASSAMAEIGYKDYDEIANEIIHTIAHEEGHLCEFLERGELKGGWEGRDLFSALRAAMGIPSPWGCEETAEEVAVEASSAMTSTTPEIIDLLKEELKRDWTCLDEDDAERIRRALEKNKDKVFFGGSDEVDAAYGKVYVSVRVDDEYLEKKGYKYDPKDTPSEAERKRAEFEYKVLKELLGDDVDLTIHDFSIGFFSLEAPAIELKCEGLVDSYYEYAPPEE